MRTGQGCHWGPAHLHLIYPTEPRALGQSQAIKLGSSANALKSALRAALRLGQSASVYYYN